MDRIKMTVEGEVVTEAQIAAGLSAISKGDFVAKDVEKAMLTAGCSEAVAYRGADRLIQREKKAGRIVWGGRNVGWKVVRK